MSSMPLHDAAARPSPSTSPTPGLSTCSDCCDGHPAPHPGTQLPSTPLRMYIYTYIDTFIIYLQPIYLYLYTLSLCPKVHLGPSLLQDLPSFLSGILGKAGRDWGMEKGQLSCSMPWFSCSELMAASLPWVDRAPWFSGEPEYQVYLSFRVLKQQRHLGGLQVSGIVL